MGSLFPETSAPSTGTVLRLRGKLAILSLLIAVGVLLNSCLQFRMSSREVDDFYSSKPQLPELKSYLIDERTIHYAAVGSEKGPAVIFVHGSPGSWSAFRDFLADPVLLEEATVVSVDRPGFGYSDFGQPESSLARQSELIAPLLEKYRKHYPVILVGHSLGGAVVARLAMDYPRLVDGLVMVAASLSPELEPNEWYRHGLRLPIVNLMVPRSFMVSNEEILPLRGELTRMIDLWPKIEVPVTVIHGTADSWVPVGNAYFARDNLVNADTKLVIEPDQGHFIPWERPDLVRNSILAHLEMDQQGFSAR